MPKYVDRVKETTTTTGTGSFALGGAVSGYQAFQTPFATGSIEIPYCAALNTEWEVGIGTLSGATTLTRDRILANSAGTTTALNFSAGSKEVWVNSGAKNLVTPGKQIAVARGYAVA